MAREAPAPVLDRAGEGFARVPPAGPPDYGEGPSRRPAREPLVSNARLGMAVFLVFEAMFFAGLIGAFLVLRLRSGAWPPPGQPYLPVALTWVNTGVLLFSGYTMRRSLRAIRGGDGDGLARWLLVTALYGVTFLAIQGYEWLRLVHFGLTVSNTYGGIFYTLIGFHGAHVLGAVLWLLVVLLLAHRRRFSAERYTAVQVCGMYWQFVVAVWPVLFGLVYLL